MHTLLCLALIHNNNVSRNTYLRPQLERLSQNMELHILVDKFEVWFQPEIRSHSITMAFVRDVMYQELGREWHKYRLLRPQWLLRDIVGFLKVSFIKYIVNRDGMSEQWKRNSAIETMVTAKHILAWGKFLDTDAEFLICFEDDVVFKDDSIQKFNKLLSTLAQNDPDIPCYADLGGGCQLSDLNICHLEENQDESYRHYKKPVTNTACCYLMNRKLVSTFYAILTRRPWLRLIGIDWMMNNLFIWMAKEGTECVCMHADPTIFKHGTNSGEYVSWQAIVAH